MPPSSQLHLIADIKPQPHGCMGSTSHDQVTSLDQDSCSDAMSWKGNDNLPSIVRLSLHKGSQTPQELHVCKFFFCYPNPLAKLMPVSLLSFLPPSTNHTHHPSHPFSPPFLLLLSLPPSPPLPPSLTTPPSLSLSPSLPFSLSLLPSLLSPPPSLQFYPPLSPLSLFHLQLITNEVLPYNKPVFPV